MRQYVELEYIDKKVSIEHKKFFEDPAYGWEAFSEKSMPLLVPKLPKQNNYTDCGLFLLENVETFLLKPEFLLNNLQ